jgi:hypothetical protein
VKLREMFPQGARMIRLRSMLVLFVVLVLSVSFAVPAEDAPETAYDESESLPCESTPLVSMAVPEISATAPTVRLPASRWRLESPRRPGATERDNRKDRVYPSSDSLTILDHLLRC